jgi:hypothetical protein
MKPRAVISDYSTWMDSVVRELSEISKKALWTVILATVVSRISYIVAFLIPLKVILLMGSDSVPRYFQSFIGAEDKMIWVVGLSISAVGFYAISLLADSLASRHTEAGSNQVIEKTDKLAIFQNQESRVSGYFARICRSNADLIVATMLLAVGFVVNLPLFAFLSVCLFVQCAATLVVTNRKNLGRIGLYAKEKLNVYLSVLSSVDFLLVIAFLMFTFYTGIESNTFIAIVSLIVTRQILSSITAVCLEAAYLSANRYDVNALLFAEHRQQPTKKHKTINELFNQKDHSERIARLIGASAETVDSVWRDSSDKAIYVFDIEHHTPLNTERFLEHVYPPGRTNGATNETALFTLMEPEKLHCPNLVGEYEMNGFVCRLFRIPENVDWVPDDLIKELTRNVLIQHWQLAPPSALVDRFKRTRPLLDERLSQELLAGIEIAISTDQQRSAYEQFLAVLPALREQLRSLPFFVFNPRVRPDNTLIDKHGNYMTANWGQWSIEHIGAGLSFPMRHQKWLRSVASQMSADSGVSYGDLITSACLWELDRLAAQHHYSAAIDLIAALVTSLRDQSLPYANQLQLLDDPTSQEMIA